MRRLALIALALALLAPASVKAVTPDEMLKDPVLEGRARVLSRELRCMVCQNQSIDDSDAPLAHDLRLLVRQRLEAGDSDQQVLDFLVARYGAFVLLKPPLEWQTLLLWGLAPMTLVIGIGALALMGRRRKIAAPLALTMDEEDRIAALLDDAVRKPTPPHV